MALKFGRHFGSSATAPFLHVSIHAVQVKTDMIFRSIMTSSNGSIFSVTLCGEFTGLRWPVTRNFGVFFDRDLRLNKRLSKQSRRRSFEMPSCSLWRHRNGKVFIPFLLPFIPSTWYFVGKYLRRSFCPFFVHMIKWDWHFDRCWTPVSDKCHLRQLRRTDRGIVNDGKKMTRSYIKFSLYQVEIL